jgi:cytochrome b6-f complex iron-sulfur subunit
MEIVLGIVAVVALAGVVLFTTMSRRDSASATGGLSRETRRRDSSARKAAGPLDAVGVSARELERAAVEARVRSKAPIIASEAKAPAVRVALDEDALGVTRRQFLNRGIGSMFGLGLAGFGAACIAFLWPRLSGGFGAKLTLPDSLDDIVAKMTDEKQPYYYAPGRVYVVPYPADGLGKAKATYAANVYEGMAAGVTALYQKCVHLGCKVPWCESSQWFECPCHGSQYNRVGERKGGPAPRGLDRFPVTVEGQKVTVDTGNVVLGPVDGTNTTGQEQEGPHCK